MGNQNPVFDYNKEPSRDILCIDCKSFYASVECVSRKLDPLKAKLVVMSYPSNDSTKRGSGLILASSPQAKKAYNITNISRARDLPFPYPKDLVIAPPRMNLYMQKNMEINNIYREFADDYNHSVYSVDESFLDVTDSLDYYECATAMDLAKQIQTTVFKQTGIYTTIGIGENPLLAKLALDNEAKNNRNMKAEWRYEDVAKKLWNIPELSDFWGIGSRTAKRLRAIGIFSIYDLAHADYYLLKEKLGIIGMQLYAHAWGIDRTFLGEQYTPKSKSLGNSQILNRDYTRKDELEIVVREMADQVATRLRREKKKTKCISLYIGYSMGCFDEEGNTSFSQQLKVLPTNSSKTIAEGLLAIFRRHFKQQTVRRIGVSCSSLSETGDVQLDIFEPINELEDNEKLDEVVDKLREKYGFSAVVYASSKMEGARAIARSSLVGGHAGGMGGIEGKDGKKD